MTKYVAKTDKEFTNLLQQSTSMRQAWTNHQETMLMSAIGHVVKDNQKSQLLDLFGNKSPLTQREKATLVSYLEECCAVAVSYSVKTNKLIVDTNDIIEPTMTLVEFTKPVKKDPVAYTVEIATKSAKKIGTKCLENGVDLSIVIKELQAMQNKSQGK